MSRSKERAEALAWMSELYGVDITRIWETLNHNNRSAYWVTVDGIDVHFTGLSSLMSRTKFEDKLLVATQGRLMPLSRPRDWLEVRRAIGAAMESLDGARAEEKGRDFLKAYWESVEAVATGPDWFRYAVLGHPFVKDGRLHISLPAVEKAAREAAREARKYQPSTGDVAAGLRAFGLVPTVVAIPPFDGRPRTTVRAWVRQRA